MADIGNSCHAAVKKLFFDRSAWVAPPLFLGLRRLFGVLAYWCEVFLEVRDHSCHASNEDSLACFASTILCATATRMAERETAVGDGDRSQYGRRVERISKENLYMVLAIWMECYLVWERKKIWKIWKLLNAAGDTTDEVSATDGNRLVLSLAKVKEEVKEEEDGAGAVLITAENRLFAMDYTRDGVHAVVRLLMKHPKALKHSTIYTSRRPCSFCAKLLVQCGVRQLYYLPRTPEKNGKDVDRVDSLLKVAPLAHCYFVPHVGDKVAEETTGKVNEKKVPDTPTRVKKFATKLMDQFWDEEWMKKSAEGAWPACDDNMWPRFKTDFEGIMKWISQVTLSARKKGTGFVQYKPGDVTAMNPKPHNPYRYRLATAAILEQRTDDPRRGVGAVIWKDDEIVATGWNGFPAKALHGEFPRASDKDEAVEEKKYPYVIHAEQNALLMRNTADISGSTLFVTKPPCHECVPLLKLEKVETCVIEITEEKAKEEFRRKHENLRYDVFPRELEKGTFTCFVLSADKPSSARGLTLSLPSSQKVHSPNLLKRKCISEVVRIGSAIIFHLSKLWKAKFFILGDVLLLVRLQEKFDIDHSWEWKG